MDQHAKHRGAYIVRQRCRQDDAQQIDESRKRHGAQQGGKLPLGTQRREVDVGRAQREQRKDGGDSAAQIGDFEGNIRQVKIMLFDPVGWP